MYSVLIADEESLERQAIRKMLEYSCPDIGVVLEAVNGAETLEMYCLYKPDIIFCNIKMPGKSGLDIVREIKSKNEDQLVIFLSAYNYFDYAREAISLGVSEYLLKPVENTKVLQIINKLTNILKRRDQQKQEEAEQKRKLALLDEYLAADRTGKRDNEPSVSGEPQFETQAKNMSPRLQRLMKEIGKTINEQYMNVITLDDAASSVNLSSFYFSKVFKQYWGKNFVDYLNEIRYKHACELLCNPKLSIKEVAVASGYSDSNYFSRVFKSMGGATPSEYRNNNLK
ncbi:MAG: response regulator [Bacteroides sp.]|nr:response regulator [Prevotella sp.]MCM1407547.1 response regulator [Treponema brennaborense]MCM1469303.1 response regulator [Bacteroides sp.]